MASEPSTESVNQDALRLFSEAQPHLVDVQPAAQVIPVLRQDTILHAGPPISWERMCPSMRGAILGALLYERLASTMAEAQKLAASGMIRFAPTHDHNCAATGAGVISASMPVWVIENRATEGEGHIHRRAYAPVSDGLRQGIQQGANGREALAQLNWVEGFLAPRLREVIRRSGGIDIFALLRSALQMGDEGHIRNKAVMQAFQLTLLPWMLQAKFSHKDLGELLTFMRGHNGFFLNLTLAACKAAWLRVDGMPSSLVTAIAGNGVDVGIRLRRQWHIAPAPPIEGSYLPDYTFDSANVAIGDDPLVEVSGLGGFAACGAPAIADAVGKSAEELLDATLHMYDITAGESNHFSMPILNGRGTPTGIDVVKVVASGTTPFITSSIMHRQGGVGHIGAGVWRVPLEPFAEAMHSLAAEPIES